MRRAGTSAADHRGAGRLARRERILRATVRRYGACLGRLPALERRVLVLRAALGLSEPRSRPRVAALTSTTVKRVALAERRGLQRLRALGHRGGCAALAPATIVFASAAATRAPLPVLPLIGVPTSTGSPHSGVKSEHASGVGEAPPTASSSAAPLIAGPAARDHGGGGGGIDPIMVLVPLLLLGYLGWVVRGELRKS